MGVKPETIKKGRHRRPARSARVGTAVLAILLCASCVEQKMTLKEARQVTVAMADKPFFPPPRHVTDILNVLDQKGQVDPRVMAAMRAEAEAAPPDTSDLSRLVPFYFERGLKARDLCRYKQYLEDHRLALTYQEEAIAKGARGLDKDDHARLLAELAIAEFNFGHYGRSIALLKQALAMKSWFPVILYRLLAVGYFNAGDLKAGRDATELGIRICDQNLGNPRMSPSGAALFTREKALLQSEMLDAEGRHADAEPHRKAAVRLLDQRFKTENRKAFFYYRCSLARNLALQGRLLEAEVEVREALKEAVGLAGRESGEMARILAFFGDILLLQGRTEDCVRLVHAGIRNLEASGFPKDSYWNGELLRILGDASVAKGGFREAMDQFNTYREDMRENPYALNLLSRNPNFMLSLLATGRTEEAVRTISDGHRHSLEYFGETDYRTAEMRALLGMAHIALGRDDQAMQDFGASIPLLLKGSGGESDGLRGTRLRFIIEAYMALLARIHERGEENRFRIDAPAEIFRIGQALNSSMVHSALGASGARAAALDPELADLVRREQDAGKQIDTLRRTLSNALAAPPDQHDLRALADLKAGMDSLTSARSAILDEIQRRFPGYADLLHPQSHGFSAIQANLKPQAALVVLYPAREKTYVWGIPRTGGVAFAVSPLGRDALRDRSVQLRKTLAPVPGTFGDIPEYDLDLAYGIYASLLKPVEAAWKEGTDLIVVAHGPMGQIPFAVLPTEPVRLAGEEEVLFARYREVPWLVRRCSVTQLPSVSSLVTLRALPPGDAGRKAFLGFADPYFNLDQMTRARSGQADRETLLAGQGGERLRVRGIRQTATKTLDSETGAAVRLGMLSRLPDTAEEVAGMAAILGADPAEDVFVGEQAAEARLKAMDLSNRKIIAFATHGLVPGDLDGLEEPALALSSPDVTGEKEDGLLTMGEILRLRMNADWVVLSACNTGAADGAGVEAVSGLGRAFFYAGCRALLVSMWPVETTSAKRLTTGLFRFQQEDPALSRAKALRKSMLDLLDNQVLKEEASGRVVAAYAHPFFWAAFVVVGEGG